MSQPVLLDPENAGVTPVLQSLQAPFLYTCIVADMETEETTLRVVTAVSYTHLDVYKRQMQGFLTR